MLSLEKGRLKGGGREEEEDVPTIMESCKRTCERRAQVTMSSEDRKREK